MKTDLQKIFDDMWKTGIGMEHLLDAHRVAANTMSKMSGFPPYNIRKTGENKYMVEIACAGFSIADIEITLDKNVLKIKSRGHDQSNDLGEFIHQGFAYRAFERAFTLMDNIEVNSAELINGVLKIYLEKLVPEEQQPKRINISSPSEDSHPQLLNESSVF
jgi:molecular chaperone IbpA